VAARRLPTIQANRLRRSFSEKVVLDGIDLTVPKGTVPAPLGPNGAGKTTGAQIGPTLIAPNPASYRSPTTRWQPTSCSARPDWRSGAAPHRRRPLTG
jgi:ABC-type transporter Mla maintaining outer membrane lipid asymmetry ATPase subunit MlaF